MKRFFTFLILLKLGTENEVIGKFSTARKGSLRISPEAGTVPLPKSRFKRPPLCETWIELNSTTQFATIKSPGYPFNYWPDLRCFYFATSPPGTKMSLTCEDFNVEESSNDRCDYDTFRFSLDGDLTSPYRMFSCGRGSIHQVTVNNQLTILFTSDNANVKSMYPFRFACTIQVIGKSIVPTPITTTPKPTTPSKCSCGERKLNKESRIVGGMDALPNEFPWMCSLYNPYLGYYCGCAVISENWIITAAHCAAAVGSAKNVKVNIGDHDLSISYEAPSELVSVSQMIIHPHYDSKSQDNDLSLLKLSTKLMFSESVQPICLPFKFIDKSLHGMKTTGAGWGLDEYGGRQKHILQKVNLTILETAECREFADYEEDLLTDNMFCTYGNGEKKDMCQGDSGGGINIYDKESGRFFEVGVSSWGIGCALEKKPGAYAKLTLRKYLEWIHQNTGPELCVVE